MQSRQVTQTKDTTDFTGSLTEDDWQHLVAIQINKAEKRLYLETDEQPKKRKAEKMLKEAAD